MIEVGRSLRHASLIEQSLRTFHKFKGFIAQLRYVAILL
jgi:hypothetical protein